MIAKILKSLSVSCGQCSMHIGTIEHCKHLQWATLVRATPNCDTKSNRFTTIQSDFFLMSQVFRFFFINTYYLNLLLGKIIPLAVF